MSNIHALQSSTTPKRLLQSVQALRHFFYEALRNSGSNVDMLADFGASEDNAFSDVQELDGRHFGESSAAPAAGASAHPFDSPGTHQYRMLQQVAADRHGADQRCSEMQSAVAVMLEATQIHTATDHRQEHDGLCFHDCHVPSRSAMRDASMSHMEQHGGYPQTAESPEMQGNGSLTANCCTTTMMSNDGYGYPYTGNSKYAAGYDDSNGRHGLMYGSFVSMVHPLLSHTAIKEEHPQCMVSVGQGAVCLPSSSSMVAHYGDGNIIPWSELSFAANEGSYLQLLGADTIDSLHGMYYDSYNHQSHANQVHSYHGSNSTSRGTSTLLLSSASSKDFNPSKNASPLLAPTQMQHPAGLPPKLHLPNKAANPLQSSDGSDNNMELEEEDAVADNPNTPSPKAPAPPCISSNLVSERKRRKKINEALYTLRAAVPIVSKMDKVSIVKDALNYTRQLKKRVKDMEDDLQRLQHEGSISVDSDDSLRDQKPSTSSVSELIMEEVEEYCRSLPKQKITEINLMNIEGNMFHLHMHCKEGQGDVLQLARAVTALDLDVVSTNISCMGDYTAISAVVSKDHSHNTEAVTPEWLREMIAEAAGNLGLLA